LNHKGEHFSVRGPLNVARPPQGHPVLFQAGSSEVGREVAARFAEGVFAPQHTLAGAKEFYRDLKRRMQNYKRPPETLKVMPGLNAIVGRTCKEAEELHHFLQSKIHPDVGLELLSNQLGGSIFRNTISMARFPTSPNGNSHSAGLVTPATSSAGRGRSG
jgi:alkanesulfonate monooxygenase SsuD/methylene tetrahydromethanopterin reductase-like flavin-dependent oxidoreductase (luciferase family)